MEICGSLVNSIQTLMLIHVMLNFISLIAFLEEDQWRNQVGKADEQRLKWEKVDIVPEDQKHRQLLKGKYLPWPCKDDTNDETEKIPDNKTW